MTATPRPPEPAAPGSTPGPDPGEASPWPAWRTAACRPVIDAAIRSLYDRLSQEIAHRGPTCWTSGKCCNFDAYGHRLYVTGLEIAWLLESLPAVKSIEAPVKPAINIALPQAQKTDGSGEPSYTLTLDASPGGCPFQVDKLCSVHAIRPLGCRIFFCQEGTQEWQHDLYERFLGELRELHTREGIAYQYMEWRAGLREAAATRTGREA